MPKYKLEYFGMRARGEFARLMLTYTGADWQDDKFGFEELPTRAKNSPFGLFPVLWVDGKKISQSVAIGMYLGSELGMAGKDRFEAMKTLELSAGILVDCTNFITPFVFIFLENDQEKTKAEWKIVKEGKLKGFIKAYDKFLADNGGKWFVGIKITWTDFVVAEFFERLESKVDPTLLDQCPKLRDHGKRVMALPQLKKYLDSRPPAPF